MEKQPLHDDYLNTLVELKQRIVKAQYNSYSAVNSEMILAYLDIGKVISEKTKTGWGSSVIKQLSTDLQAEFVGVKGFSERNLRRMRFVYEEMLSDSIWPQAVAKLHWGHISMIFSRIKDKTQRLFYINKVKEEAWSRSILEEKISIGILLCKSKSNLTVEYALEIVTRPMGVATYSHAELPDHFARNLPDEEQLRGIFGDIG